MFRRLAIRLGIAALGVAATLAWWSYHGTGIKTESRDRIPASVLGGGPVKITVEAESTCAATMAIDFDEEKEDGNGKMLHTWEKMAAGTKTWTVETPEKVGGYIELDADHPHAGDTLKWRVTINGTEIRQEEWTLEQDLEPKTAMFLQLYFQDYSKAPGEMTRRE